VIDGVVITPLKRIGDERGMVLHMLRRDWDVFEDFGEVYFSTVNLGVVKGWKRHKRMIQNFAVPMGNAKFVLYDDREDSPTMGEVQDVTLGQDNYVLLTLPAMIWYGFTGTGDGPTLIANCASLPHDPEETEGRDLSDPAIPYDWTTKG
jgi:dTDP-4-dehydrorhamnose 3,5-epimerase